jgi:peptidoglycan/xylan/chitin deacetylase (PgdA/CDA1 family)
LTPIKILYKLLRYSGLPFLFREILFRNSTRIVMFHDIGAEAAERAFGYLARRYNIVSLNDYLTGRPMPPKSLVITLDDGHIGNHALLPVVKRLGIRPTIFLCAGIVDTRRRFWFLHKHPTVSTEALKKLPNDWRLQVLAEAGFHQEKEFEAPQALSKAQIEEMKGAFDLQSHTVFHPCLPQCSDETARAEIFDSKRILEEQFGLKVEAFAFPNGDYSERDIEMIRQAGYICAITVDYGFNAPGADPFRLRRLSIDDTGNLDALSLKASGVWTPLMALIGKQRLKGLKN